ncbi:hypothetical protein KP509_21G076400 [Ceratopteris richardii]|uniref:Uncharacterized protein n=1 Tax=Ceratopteris richardii TaxID=49495 RepID=A0A8T2SDK4_CERRI|nr:hypothetical protein KP509_21G076400 [Ceratopteris richardii]
MVTSSSRRTRLLLIQCRRLALAVLCLHLLQNCRARHGELSAVAMTFPDQAMELSPDEASAVYEVFEAVNNEVLWRHEYPTNLCVEGPHGLVCAADEQNILHVVELNIGWVSEANNNVKCGPHAAISPALTRFPFLRKLFFYSCFISDEVMLPSFLWRLGSSVEELVFLRNEKLVGGLSGAIANLTNLKRVIFADNMAFGGAIPEQLGLLSGLEQLVLSRNDHIGELPRSFNMLKRLRVLDLSWNSLQGAIPSSVLNSMEMLQKLDLSHNNLSSTIPDSISKASSLQLIDLSWNNLSGPLPDASLGKLVHLRVLQLSYNSFQGSSLPTAMWTRLGRVMAIGIAQSGLVGKIPESLGKVKRLRSLNLSANQLEGPIPGSLEDLHSIFEMDLSGNRLQGLFPFSAGFIQRMGSNLKVGNNDGLCRRPGQLLNVSFPLEYYISSAHMGGSTLAGPLPECSALELAQSNYHEALPSSSQHGAITYDTSEAATAVWISIMTRMLPCALATLSYLVVVTP